jgi:hypothetical protein
MKTSELYLQDELTGDRSLAVALIREYLIYYPKDRYETTVLSRLDAQSNIIKIIMKRLREPKS